jgi:thiamine-phosphate pyrophosphorylase
MPASGPHCQLYLVLETDAHGAGLERLEAVLKAAGPAVACVLLKPRPGAALGHGELQTAIHRVQACDVAVLLADDAELARALGADGVHLSATADEAEARSRYAIARAVLGSERTVGASAGHSRHIAMVLGEIGADYVAFEPRPSGTPDDEAEALAAWWAPLFAVPVVALGVESAAEADRLAAAGVEFIGVTLGGGPPDALARHVARMAEAISTAESAI